MTAIKRNLNDLDSDRLIFYESLAKAFTEGKHLSDPDKLLVACDVAGISLGRIIEHLGQDLRETSALYTEETNSESVRRCASECLLKINHVIDHVGGACLKCVKQSKYTTNFWRENSICSHAGIFNSGPGRCPSWDCGEHPQ